jgi:glycosyltransferase involved in cell wall biosynthesis
MPQEAQRAQVLSIVIPVYNERDTWRELVARVEAVALPELGRQIILVEDGSSDGTRQQLQELAEQVAREDPSPPPAGQVRHKVVFHERNQGKGAALRTGFAAADGDIVIVQDADLEYDPNDYPRLLAPILAGTADVVYGTRFSRGGGRRGYWANYLANRLLTSLSNLKTGLKLTDMETCYKTLRRDVLRQLFLEQDRYGFEPEVTAKLAQLPVRIVEVPIAYHGRTHAEGKKIGWKDGVQAVRCIFRYGRRRRRAATMEQAE